MNELLNPFRTALVRYCQENDLDYKKLISFPMCGNEKVLFIQYWKQKDTLKKDDTIPAEVLIKAEIADDGSTVITPGDRIKRKNW